MTDAVLMEFEDAGNYRGNLLVKAEDGKYFWRVDCDLDEYEDWAEIPQYLYEALRRHHSEKKA